MIRVETKVRLPFLWGKAVFRKEIWSEINLIVGPNGSGKTLLAQGIAQDFEKNGIDVTFIRSERVERDDLYAELAKDQKVRTCIEEVLSNMFGKEIRFEETENGVVPVVVNKNWGVEYNLKDGECHGLKEIISLLVSLYSCKTRCLILDEPELHLHPQFQLFFMNEIRRVSEENPDRIFFLITHSPFFLDLKFSEDLIGVVVCHINKMPTFVESLSDEDKTLLWRFLPRFNTYHKQFFFSDNQIFVEGYTDQQMFTNLLNCLENKHKAAGTGIIDVGGKDELGVFFKVCSLLGTDGRIITDLDSLFAGKLRDVICTDERPQIWLDKQLEKQMPFYRMLFTKRELLVPVCLEKLIRRLELFLNAIGNFVCEINYSISPEIDLFVMKVQEIRAKHESTGGMDTFRTVILQGVIQLNTELGDILPVPLALTIPLIRNLFSMILAATETAKVYILPDGCIEHYYRENEVKYMPVSAKDRLFHNELDYLNIATQEQIKERYRGLLDILQRACSRD